MHICKNSHIRTRMNALHMRRPAYLYSKTTMRFFVLVLFLILPIDLVYSCSCIDRIKDKSPAEAIEWAAENNAMIFLGTVEPSNTGRMSSVKSIWRVEKVWKGKFVDSIEVNQTSMGMCTLFFVEGGRYLVFTYLGKDGSHYTHFCSLTMPASRARKYIKELNKIYD